MKIYSLLLCLFFSVPFVSSASAQSSTEDIRYVQEYLSAKNLYTGYIDGIDGPLTKKAVLDYEQQSGKRLTGKISKKLINLIRFNIRYELQVQEKKELNYKASEWSILAVIVGLTAYIGSIRRRFLDKENEKDAAKKGIIQELEKIVFDKKIIQELMNMDAAKRKLIQKVNRLMWADVPLVIAGLCIAAFNLWPLFKSDPSLSLFKLGILMFGFALIILAIFHASEWFKKRNP